MPTARSRTSWTEAVLARVANLALARRRAVAVAAVVVAAVTGVFGFGVAQQLDPLGLEDPESESVRANAVLDAAGRQGPDLIVLVGGDASMRDVAGELRDEPLAERVTTSGRYAFVTFEDATNQEERDAAERVEEAVGGDPGVAVGGRVATYPQITETVESDVRRAELYAFPILLVLSLLFFRSLVAAALPLVVGGLSILIAFAALRVISEVTSISVLALNLVTALGLGLGLDYSLFMVSRFREEVVARADRAAALRATLATAGRTVVFSAATVGAAMAALLVFPQRYLTSMGIGGILVAVTAGAVSLLVLPALLALLGPKVNALAPALLKRSADRDASPEPRGFWYRLALTVMRRPGWIAAVTAVVLLALSAPFLRADFTSVDASVLPDSAGARQVHEALVADGRITQTTPVVAVLRDAGRGEALRVRRWLADAPGVGRVGDIRELDRPGRLAIAVVPEHGAYADGTEDLVRAVRDRYEDARGYGVAVTGATAQFLDLKQSLVDHLPAAGLIIAAATMIALFLMTGSVTLGIKALLMNFLTLAAVLGVLVLIFQDGRLESLLGFTSQGALEATAPFLLFAAVFALSTDYGMFLLARVKEARDRGASDRDAVAVGQERTGRPITSAAVLFCVAVGAFATTRIIGAKEATFGIALAVLVDATLVRALLVPSLMQLLGRWNWWSPRWLQRVHDRFGVREEQPPVPEPAPDDRERVERDHDGQRHVVVDGSARRAR